MPTTIMTSTSIGIVIPDVGPVQGEAAGVAEVDPAAAVVAVAAAAVADRIRKLYGLLW